MPLIFSWCSLCCCACSCAGGSSGCLSGSGCTPHSLTTITGRTNCIDTITPSFVGLCTACSIRRSNMNHCHWLPCSYWCCSTSTSKMTLMHWSCTTTLSCRRFQSSALVPIEPPAVAEVPNSIVSTMRAQWCGTILTLSYMTEGRFQRHNQSIYGKINNSLQEKAIWQTHLSK